MIPIPEDIRTNETIPIEEAVSRCIPSKYSWQSEVKKLIESRPNHYAPGLKSHNPFDEGYREDGVAIIQVDLDQYFDLLEELIQSPEKINKYIGLMDPRAKELQPDELDQKLWVQRMFGIGDGPIIYCQVAEGAETQFDEYVETVAMTDFVGSEQSYQRHKDYEGVNRGRLRLGLLKDANALFLEGGSDCPKLDTTVKDEMRFVHLLRGTIKSLTDCDAVEAVYLNPGKVQCMIPTYRK